MNDDRWITKDFRTGKLCIRFRVRGFKNQFFLATGLPDTKKNRMIVVTRRDIIQHDIALGKFDPTLNRYRFGNTKLVRPSQANKVKSISELWELFTLFQSGALEETTIINSYAAVARYLKRCPIQDCDRAPEIREWLLQNTTRYMTWHLLCKLNQCCNWAVSAGLIFQNSFKPLQIDKPKKKSIDEEPIKAFSLEQREIIINGFASSETYSHYTNLIMFLFLTGCRPGEAFALTWADISGDGRRISITKSKNVGGILKGTKNGKRRVFPAGENSRLQRLLLGMRPLKWQSSQLVFVNKQGGAMTSATLNNVWNQTVKNRDGRTIRTLGVVRELSQIGLVPYLKPYATRHTFATWAIASGVTVEKVALWLGDEVGTVIQYYCHPEIVEADCPDF